jgi:hypothetical protein
MKTNDDLQTSYRYHKRECEKLAAEIRKAERDAMKPAMTLSAEFIPREELQLLRDISCKKETAEEFSKHIRSIYAAELQKRRDEKAALEAAHPRAYSFRIVTREEMAARYKQGFRKYRPGD